MQVGTSVYQRNRRQLIKTEKSNEATLQEDMAAPDDLTPTSAQADETAPPNVCPIGTNRKHRVTETTMAHKVARLA